MENTDNYTDDGLFARKLAFPAGAGTFVHRGADGDSVVLNSSNEWSRKLDEVFRLHSSRSTIAPASLAWTQVPLSGFSYRLIFSAKLSVDYSLPASVTVRVAADDRLIGAWFAEVKLEGVSCEMLIPEGFERLSVEVEALRFFDLKHGEVSAIDVSPIEIHRVI